MRATIKRETLLKNSKGQYRYQFNWIGGGFNDIWAKNLKEFTLHKATPSGARDWDRAGNMMCW